MCLSISGEECMNKENFEQRENIRKYQAEITDLNDRKSDLKNSRGVQQQTRSENSKTKQWNSSNQRRKKKKRKNENG